MADFFQPLGDELEQGDILEYLPVGPIAAPLEIVRHWKDQAPPERTGTAFLYGNGPFKRPPAPPLYKDAQRAEFAQSRSYLKRCIVLSDDCVALAKASNKEQAQQVSAKVKNAPWHVAPLEPMPSDGEFATTSEGKVKLADLIRAGRVKRSLHIPAAEGLPEGYVDLRFVTGLEPSLLVTAKRVAALSPYGRAMLTVAIYTYFSGKPLGPSFSCPHCSTTIDLASVNWSRKPATT